MMLNMHINDILNFILLLRFND